MAVNPDFTPHQPPGSPSPPPPEPSPPEPQPPSGTGSGAVTYALVGSYPTVQVLSSTLINNVVYCTIQTQPHKVVASIPVEESVFNEGAAGVELTNFAQAIETIMSDPRIVAGVGTQSIDPSGLLADNVTFTVEYTDPVRAPNGATADATVPVTLLNFTDGTIGGVFRSDVAAIIDGVYANLQAAAGG